MIKGWLATFLPIHLIALPPSLFGRVDDPSGRLLGRLRREGDIDMIGAVELDPSAIGRDVAGPIIGWFGHRGSKPVCRLGFDRNASVTSRCKDPCTAALVVDRSRRKGKTEMHATTVGQGRAMLLLHGPGSSGHAWRPVLDGLGSGRRLIVPDLPGHGRSPAEEDSGSFQGLVRSVQAFLSAEHMTDIDMVGSSLCARIVLELARRGIGRHVVALDPGGFWEGWERQFAVTSLSVSRALAKSLKAALPALAGNPLSRSALLAQLSARPWALDGGFVAEELRALADTPTVPDLIKDLGYCPGQDGTRRTAGKLALGWGRHDRLCLPQQARRAAERFPAATLHWFQHSGHFPMWDEPGAVIRLIHEVCG